MGIFKKDAITWEPVEGNIVHWQKHDRGLFSRGKSIVVKQYQKAILIMDGRIYRQIKPGRWELERDFLISKDREIVFADTREYQVGFFIKSVLTQDRIEVDISGSISLSISDLNRFYTEVPVLREAYSTAFFNSRKEYEDIRLRYSNMNNPVARNAFNSALSNMYKDAKFKMDGWIRDKVTSKLRPKIASHSGIEMSRDLEEVSSNMLEVIRPIMLRYGITINEVNIIDVKLPKHVIEAAQSKTLAHLQVEGDLERLLLDEKRILLEGHRLDALKARGVDVSTIAALREAKTATSDLDKDIVSQIRQSDSVGEQNKVDALTETLSSKKSQESQSGSSTVMDPIAQIAMMKMMQNTQETQKREEQQDREERTSPNPMEMAHKVLKNNGIDGAVLRSMKLEGKHYNFEFLKDSTLCIITINTDGELLGFEMRNLEAMS